MSQQTPILEAASQPRLSAREFELFRELVHDKTGISLNDSKRSLVESRLARCLRLHGMKSYREYYRWLVEGEGAIGHHAEVELQQMINCMTTNKTSFFREPHHFEFLADQVLADRLRQAESGAPHRVRIWSAASSRGQEPYTIAMTIADTLPVGWDARILATDIDTDVLQHARQGTYPIDEIADLPIDTKRRHFLKGAGNLADKCQVKPHLQQMITFRRLNLVHDPLDFRTQFDVIFLRNVMIYFSRATQERVLARLKDFLVPGGYLILGHSENICWSQSDYKALGATIYQVQGAES